MAARAEQQGRQMDFGGPFDIPGMVRRVDDLVSEIPLATILKSDPLWRTRPDGRALLTNTETGMGAVFDPEIFLIEYDFFGDAPVSTHSFAAGIIVVGDANSNERVTHAAERVTRRLFHGARNQGRLFIIESAPVDDQADWRLALLDSHELVERAIVKRDGVFLWRGRRKKEAVRHGHDYLDRFSQSDEPWRKRFFPDLFAAMAEAYQDAGYTLVDTSEIESALRESSWLQRDIGRIRSGFGVMVEARCGCRWHVGLNGVSERMLPTCETGCDGLPPAPLSENDRNPLPTFLIEIPEELDAFCRGCSEVGYTAYLVRTCRAIGPAGDNRTRIFVEKKCPHHGVVTKQTIVVFNTQLRYE